MSINVSLLPSEHSAQKGVFFYPGNQRTAFGVVLTLSRDQYFNPQKYLGADLNQNWLQIIQPEVYRVITGQKPDDVQVEVGWYSDDYNVSWFVMYALTLPHRKLPFVSDDFYTNDAMLLMLSAMLQLGEKPNHRNLLRHRNSDREKYLPLTIGRDSLYYHVYMPTQERVLVARDHFARAADMIYPLLAEAPKLLKLIYAAVRLSEVSSSSGLIPAALEDVQGQIAERMNPYTKQLGFVYQDLPGPQDTVAFSYGMLAAK